MTQEPFIDFYNSRDVIIFNGAMGTELQRRGYKTALPLWSASANEDAFDLVKEIHEDYFKAGADISITNTFRTTPRSYKKVGREEDARHAMKEAVRAAKEAGDCVDRPTYVGGSIATLEDCYYVERVPSEQELQDEHAELAQWLAEDGVDFIALETINNLKEAVAMADAAQATGLPFMISFMVDEKGYLFDGAHIKDVVEQTDRENRFIVSLNCRPIDTLNSALDELHECNHGDHFAIYPNGFGHPHDDLGWHFEENEDSLDKFVDIAQNWKNQGAKILGGCCGTTPKYIEALTKAIAQDKKAA